jgi:uncharacterized cupin superfamily protein
VSGVIPRSHDALAMGLEDLPLPASSVQSGTPVAGITTLREEFGVEVGVWELTEGTVTDTEVDEVFVVLSGSGSVTFADGERLELHPGVVVRLRDGEHTAWTVTETIRKLWICP